MDALNGPVGQLGVPLAAAGLSAAFPRRGAPAVHAGLGALGAMQDYRTNNMRLQELTQHHAAEDNYYGKLGESLNSLEQPKSPVGGVSGNAPAATAALQSSTQEATGQPPPIHGTMNIDPSEVSYIRAGLKAHDPIAVKRLTDILAKRDESSRLPSVAMLGDLDAEKMQRAGLSLSGKTQEGVDYSMKPPDVPNMNVSEFTDAAGNRQQTLVNPKSGAREQVNMGAVQSTPLHDSYVDAGGNQMMAIVDPRTGATKNVPLGKARPQSTGNGTQFSSDDAGAISDAIIDGKQPPTLQGLYRQGAPVRAALAKKGFDLAGAQLDYTAVQKHLATLNNSQQERLRQAVSFAHDSLGNIENLYNEWQTVGPASGFKVFNRAALAAAKQVPGRAGEIAQTLDAQIADLTSELGTVYMGGNSSTDHGLSLAAKNLSSDWNDGQFKSALKALRTNLTIRRNSILSSQPVGVSAGSPYLHGRGGDDAAPTTDSGQATAPSGQFKYTATGPKGEKVGSNDGVTWQPLQ